MIIQKGNKMKNNLIKHWVIIKEYGNCYLEGNIYNDAHKRFENGKHIRTSKIRTIDFDKGIVITQNSVYYLNQFGENLGE